MTFDEAAAAMKAAQESGRWAHCSVIYTAGEEPQYFVDDGSATAPDPTGADAYGNGFHDALGAAALRLELEGRRGNNCDASYARAGAGILWAMRDARAQRRTESGFPSLEYRAAMAVTGDPSLDTIVMAGFFARVRRDTIKKCAKLCDAVDNKWQLEMKCGQVKQLQAEIARLREGGPYRSEGCGS